MIVVVLAILLLMTTAFPALERQEKRLQTLSDGSTFVIEGLDFVSHVSSLNPFRYYSEQGRMIVKSCMSNLLTYDPNGEVIGDVADTWTVSEDGMNWSLRMQPDIYFCDPLDPTARTHKMTWMDVQYAYFQVQNYSNNLQHYLLCNSAKVVKRIWGSSEADWVNISLNMPFAPMTTALTEIPIIPRYYWQPHEDHTGDATRWPGYSADGGYTNLPLVGSGPWYCEMTDAGLMSSPSPTELTLHRNPIWFQEANRGWHLGVDTLVYRQRFLADQEWSDLELGSTDMIMDVNRSVFLNDLPSHPSMFAWAQSTGWYFEYNLNQMTTKMRTDLGKESSSIARGHNTQLFQDPIIRRALTMALDKGAFVDQVLDGVGSPADSLIAETNPWHYDPEGQVAFDLAGANALLEANGYQDTDADGVRECTASSPAVQKEWAPLGTELFVRFYTLGGPYAGYVLPEYQIGAELIRDWAAQIGINLNLTLKSYSQMTTSVWLAADYDAWLWYWQFYPYSDPSLDVMFTLTTMATSPSPMWTDVWYSNATFDSVYNSSLVAVGPTSRRVITNELQQMAYDSMASHPVAYVCNLYASNCSRWARSSFEGCGVEWTMSPDSALPWLFMRLTPGSPVDISVRISLYPGWNLIGIPLNRTFLASEIGLAPGEEIVRWSFATQSFDKSYVEGVSPPSMDFLLVKGYGYFVYCLSEESLVLYGPPLAGPQIIELNGYGGGGWALVSSCFPKTVFASTFADNVLVSGGPILTVTRWDAQTHQYVTHILGLPPWSTPDFQIHPTEGYWIYVDGPGTLTYDAG